MHSRVEYRMGTLKGLRNLRFDEGLSVKPGNIEFNVLGMGHEFWIAVQDSVVIAVTVLGTEDETTFKILTLEVTPSRKKEGVGSALVKAITQAYPDRGFTVIPFEGTDEFYEQLGFVHTGRWEMKRGSGSSKR
jgi:GNAT superfamily N-acetyltransferase